MQARTDVAHLATDLDGGPPDLELFFAEQHLRLIRALYFVTGNRSDAAELMQDAFSSLNDRRARRGSACSVMS